jgi:hypothetical protein
MRRRVRGIVDSLLRPDELEEMRLEWVTPDGGRLRFSPQGWEGTLVQLANDLEDWLCETSFGWGQERIATVPS